MSYAILKDKFDGRRRIGDIPCFDGTVPVLEGTDEEKYYFPIIEKCGYKIVEVDLPPNVGYFWEHYNQMVQEGGPKPWELGYGDPPAKPKAVKKTAPKKIEAEGAE